ncbi:hypothetical protein L208DRAFT_1452480 [Tricholoma matsutake]|nr:hypothetical protein L208DRAFT_1452480 [Tricholoma matsutake 945]
MASFLRAYNTLLLRRPYLATCTTAAVLFGAGDVIAQQGIEGRGKQHDFMRTARLSFYGGTMFGPCITTWYRFLNGIKFASPTRAVVYRVWLDQTTFSPFVLVLFFGSMSVLEGKAHEAMTRIKSAYVPTLILNWSVFAPTQIINFALVPPHLRFVFVGVVSLCWNTYLSASNSYYRRTPLLDIDEIKGGMNEVD